MRGSGARLIAGSAVALLAAAATPFVDRIVPRIGAQATGAHRLVWRGHISDEKAHFGRALSGGGVPRMPEPATFAYSISVDFEYVQQVEADGSVSWPKRHLAWTLDGVTGDNTVTVTCHGDGSLDLAGGRDAGALSADERRALQAKCETTQTAIAFRLYGSLPQAPPMPMIPGVDELDEGCSYRREDGSRRTAVWLTPDVEAVVEMDASAGSPYQRWAPEPGKTVELTARTVPAYPARFRFVIDKAHTSNFAGYADNAYVDATFFERYRLQHLAAGYTDLSPDLIFDPQQFDRRVWSRVDEDIVETTDERAGATATVTAMDYGAIGQVRAFAKFKCGGWVPVKIVVNGAARDALSVPLDEDHNLMADALDDYNGDPGRDDDAEPEGDGTKGDGLTAFEEYRGFMTQDADCDHPIDDRHVRTTPRHKHLFLASDYQLLRLGAMWFPTASGISTIEMCQRHLWDLDTVDDLFDGYGGDELHVPPETRVVNFTLERAGQTRFAGHVIHLGPQHGVFLTYDRMLSRIGGMEAMAVPTEAIGIGPPRLTAVLAVHLKYSLIPKIEDNAVRKAAVTRLLTVVAHELGHAIGIPHHSDSRRNWRIVPGVLNVTFRLSPFQSRGIMLGDDVPAEVGDDHVDALLIEPGPGCQKGDPDPAYVGDQFAGCLASLIVRRGQQDSGDVSCPMRYWFTEFFELPGTHAEFHGAKVVTDRPNPSPDDLASGKAHSVRVHAWGGSLFRWSIDVGQPGARVDRFCQSPRGTLENARADYWNLAGDAGRADPCRSFVVVNDFAPSDPRTGAMSRQ